MNKEKKSIEEKINFRFFAPFKRGYTVPTAPPPLASYLSEFLNLELNERVFYHEFSEYSLLFEETIITMSPVQFFKTEESNLQLELQLARNKLAKPEAKLLYQKNRNLADNVFLDEMSLFNLNKKFCNTLINRIGNISIDFKDSYGLNNRPKYELIRENMFRNEILRRIFKTREAYEAYHDYKMQHKARIVRNVEAYENNLAEVLKDEGFDLELIHHLREKLTIQFPSTPPPSVFDDYSMKETEYMFIKAKTLFGY